MIWGTAILCLNTSFFCSYFVVYVHGAYERLEGRYIEILYQMARELRMTFWVCLFVWIKGMGGVWRCQVGEVWDIWLIARFPTD